MLSVGNKNFSSQDEYEAALQDQKLIDSLKRDHDLDNPEDVKSLYYKLQSVKFISSVGKEFDDYVYDLYTSQGSDARSIRVKEPSNDNKNRNMGPSRKEINGKANQNKKVSRNKEVITTAKEQKISKEVMKELKRRYRNRNIIIAVLILISFLSIGYFVKYYYDTAADQAEYKSWAELKNAELPDVIKVDPVLRKDYAEDVVIPEILDEYKLLYNKNKSLIGWVKIDDTKIDYPVMQTVNNEYYLKHNFEQDEDINGCIFLDKDCDVILENTNYILYGHHMKSGKMFGSLVEYGNEDFYSKHKIIHFDTIYKKSDYEIMYVFRSRIYNADEITFKYYQFIDANSEAEFDSYMEEMANLSIIDTGITAKYGDQLLTLSTCDYQEENGRFVVVAKRIDE